jgi:hypothetical protein
LSLNLQPDEQSNNTYRIRTPQKPIPHYLQPGSFLSLVGGLVKQWPSMETAPVLHALFGDDNEGSKQIDANQVIEYLCVR